MTTAIERLRAALVDDGWQSAERRADAARALAEIEAGWEALRAEAAGERARAERYRRRLAAVEREQVRAASVNNPVRQALDEDDRATAERWTDAYERGLLRGPWPDDREARIAAMLPLVREMREGIAAAHVEQSSAMASVVTQIAGLFRLGKDAPIARVIEAVRAAAAPGEALRAAIRAVLERADDNAGILGNCSVVNTRLIEALRVAHIAVEQSCPAPVPGGEAIRAVKALRETLEEGEFTFSASVESRLVDVQRAVEQARPRGGFPPQVTAAERAQSRAVMGTVLAMLREAHPGPLPASKVKLAIDALHIADVEHTTTRPALLIEEEARAWSRWDALPLLQKGRTRMGLRELISDGRGGAWAGPLLAVVEARMASDACRGEVAPQVRPVGDPHDHAPEDEAPDSVDPRDLVSEVQQVPPDATADELATVQRLADDGGEAALIKLMGLGTTLLPRLVREIVARRALDGEVASADPRDARPVTDAEIADALDRTSAPGPLAWPGDILRRLALAEQARRGGLWDAVGGRPTAPDVAAAAAMGDDDAPDSVDPRDLPPDSEEPEMSPAERARREALRDSSHPQAVQHPDAIKPAPERQCVAVLVTELDGDVLLVKTRRGWELPGGKVKPGETLLDAAVRECIEETGIKPDLADATLQMISDGTWIYQGGARKSGDLRVPDADILSVGWARPKSVLSLPLSDLPSRSVLLAWARGHAR